MSGLEHGGTLTCRSSMAILQASVCQAVIHLYRLLSLDTLKRKQTHVTTFTVNYRYWGCFFYVDTRVKVENEF